MCNCNEGNTYNIGMGCCVPVLCDANNYYTKREVDSMVASASSDVTREDIEAIEEEIGTLQGELQEKASEASLASHTEDSSIHVTNADKQRWDNAIPTKYASAVTFSNKMNPYVANSRQYNVKFSDGSTFSMYFPTINGKAITLSTTYPQDFKLTEETAFKAHTADTATHTTQAEKDSWDDAIEATEANTRALGGYSLRSMTKADYDALATKDANTLYLITD